MSFILTLPTSGLACVLRLPGPWMLQDLQCLGRDLGQTIIVDNSPHSYMFQPENALPIGTFIDDMQDQVGARPPPGFALMTACHMLA